MVIANIAVAASDHDGLVIAHDFGAMNTVDAQLEGTKITAQGWATKFVIKCRTAKWALQHDVARSDDAIGLAIWCFPWLHKAGDIQVRYRKASESRLGFATATGRTFITDFTTRACRCTGKWRNRGRVVMRFHFHQNMHGLVIKAVSVAAIEAIKTIGFAAGNDRGIIVIGR